MIVYIVNGLGGSGKTTFEEMVILNAWAIGTTTSMVEIVKYHANQMGWNGGKTDADRRFLSDLKDALARWHDSPMQFVIHKITEYNDEEFSFVFVDAREKEDINRLKEWCGQMGYRCKTILVDREIIKEYGNHADDGVMDYHYDMTIMNTGTLEDLEKIAKSFVKEEGL